MPWTTPRIMRRLISRVSFAMKTHSENSLRAAAPLAPRPRRPQWPRRSAARLLAQIGPVRKARQIADVPCRQASIARPRNDDLHVARPRPAAPLAARHIDERGAALVR